MRFRTILSLATLFFGLFTLAVWNQELSADRLARGAGAATENRSISGKISSIGDASFSVDVVKDDHSKQTVHFLVDDTTKVEGRLAIGAQAVVEYRSSSGDNVAVHIVVTPASGHHSR